MIKIIFLSSSFDWYHFKQKVWEHFPTKIRSNYLYMYLRGVFILDLLWFRTTRPLQLAPLLAVGQVDLDSLITGYICLEVIWLINYSKPPWICICSFGQFIINSCILIFSRNKLHTVYTMPGGINFIIYNISPFWISKLSRVSNHFHQEL